MKIGSKFKRFILCVGLPLLGGILVSLIISGETDAYTDYIKPPLAPPQFLFPVVWSILYVLMGVSLFGVMTSGAEMAVRQNALRTFTSQLLINYLWPIIFFIIKTYWAAAVCLAFLIILVLLTYKEFAAIDKKSANLLIPYLIWLVFALYLNIGVAILN